jgi:cardiolipin synthase
MLTAVLLALVILLSVVIWSIKRHREPILRVVSHKAPLHELVRSLAGLTHSSIVEGNSVEAFENGAFFDALLDDIRAASRSIHFQSYLWEEGSLSDRVSRVLAERANAGVRVRVLVDASGGNRMGERAARVLGSSKCRLELYHPRRLRNLGLQNNRDHRKLVVLDGRSAFLGGHCIKDAWLGDAQDKAHFRDLSVRVRGPAVHALQSTFSESWVEESGELFTGDDVFPPLEPQGDVAIHVARVTPAGCAPAVKILHHLVIGMARRNIFIQNPYFLPALPAIAALADAVARGVDVRVMVPAAEVSDFPLVQHAAHRNFARLLAAGVRIFEYRRTLLHQKTMTVDGVWCAIGSSNFDDRSLEINREVTAGFCGERLAAHLESIFERDARDCVELGAHAWARRGRWHRLRDEASHLLRYQL